jgi:hypothetical protein
MSWEQIGSGTNSNIQDIEGYESYMDEGQKGLLTLSFSCELPDYLIDEIRQKMNDQGVEGAGIEKNGNAVNIYFQKGMPWLPVIIAIIIGLIVVLVIILVSWHIFKEVVPAPLQGAVGTMLLIGAVVIGGAFAIKKLRG